MSQRIHLLACLVFVAASACSYTDPGTGSGTLQIAALLHYDTTPTTGDPQTAVQITLTKNGAAVTNPTIQFQDADTAQTFVIVSPTNPNGITSNPNVFVTSINGYHRRMALSVSSGSDNLQVKLEGPGPFSITSPQSGAQVQLAGGLNVQWETQDGVTADQVALKLPTNSTQVYYTSDSGTYTFPSNVLQSGANALNVTRTNKVVPAGAVGQSLFQIDYEVDVNFIVNG